MSFEHLAQCQSLTVTLRGTPCMSREASCICAVRLELALRLQAYSLCLRRGLPCKGTLTLSRNSDPWGFTHIVAGQTVSLSLRGSLSATEPQRALPAELQCDT